MPSAHHRSWRLRRRALLALVAAAVVATVLSGCASTSVSGQPTDAGMTSEAQPTEPAEPTESTESTPSLEDGATGETAESTNDSADETGNGDESAPPSADEASDASDSPVPEDPTLDDPAEDPYQAANACEALYFFHIGELAFDGSQEAFDDLFTGIDPFLAEQPAQVRTDIETLRDAFEQTIGVTDQETFDVLLGTDEINDASNRISAAAVEADCMAGG